MGRIFSFAGSIWYVLDKRRKKKFKKYMHSSYQLNTVFTDVYLLLLQNYKLAQVATWLTSRYSYGTTLLWNPFSMEWEGEGLAAGLGCRTAARSQTWPAPWQKGSRWATSLSTTRLYWRDRSKPHSLLYTRYPSAAILLHMCFIFQNF